MPTSRIDTRTSGCHPDLKGAVFLPANCSLQQRPMVYLLLIGFGSEKKIQTALSGKKLLDSMKIMAPPGGSGETMVLLTAVLGGWAQATGLVWRAWKVTWEGGMVVLKQGWTNLIIIISLRSAGQIEKLNGQHSCPKGCPTQSAKACAFWLCPIQATETSPAARPENQND